MINMTGRRFRAWVKFFLLVLSLVLIWVCFFAMSDRLIEMITPQSLLRCALPFLHGVDVPVYKLPIKNELDDQDSHDNDDQSETNQDEHDGESHEIQFEIMQPDDGVSDKIRIELMGTKRNETIDLSGNNPKVLIYHTHTTEAYTQSPAYPYERLYGDDRTTQNDRNIVAVGEKLARMLHDDYGIAVIHDTTNHEPPKLSTSYTRSLETMEDYLEKFPSIELFIDVHRDAYTLGEGEENKDYTEIDGQKVARLMFVVGTGEGKTGAGFSIKPNYKNNYALALSITDKLKEVNPKLARPIRVKTQRYNQHIPGSALLVEVGHNANTLEEALASIPYLAKAIADSAKISQD